MLSRFQIIQRILNEMGVYNAVVARDIDNGKEGTVTALGGIKTSYRRIRETADRILTTSKGL